MSMTFTKLFSSITESTLWCEPDRVRLVWITMLAMADARGRVWASVPGLANRARVPLEDAEEAIQRFLSPDKYSRTPEHEGRRIEVIDGGWRLLNHEKYRAIRDEESIKESKRKYINSRRQAEREVLQSSTASTVEPSRHNAEADAEANEEITPPPPNGGVPHSENAKPQKAPKAAKPTPPARPDDVSEQTWADWLALRASKRAPVTRTVLAGAVAEAVKAGLTTEEFLQCWCRRGSQGLEAAWLRQDERPGRCVAPPITVPSDAGEKTAAYLAEQSAHKATPPPNLTEIRQRLAQRKLA